MTSRPRVAELEAIVFDRFAMIEGEVCRRLEEMVAELAAIRRQLGDDEP